MSDEVIAELTPVGILSYIAPENLEALKYYGVFGEYGLGEVVVEQGVQQDMLYFVVSGEMEVTVSSTERQVKVGEIGPGDCLGELSIFEPGPASATVVVTKTCVLWCLEVQALQTFFQRLPVAGGQLMLGIAQLLSKRLRHANNAILSNEILPNHLGVRSGSLKEPIRADSAGGVYSQPASDTGQRQKASGGLLGGLFGGKKDDGSQPSISTHIRR